MASLLAFLTLSLTGSLEKPNLNVVIDKILKQPIYAGLQRVKPFKEYPGGLFPLNVEPLISLHEWNEVQKAFEAPIKERTIVDDNLPLRGLLKCHCGKPLTGAPSRGRHGGYFYYYKCKESRHLNLSAKKAHTQLESVFELMSLSAKQMKFLSIYADKAFENKMKEEKVVLKQKQIELQEEQKKLNSIEEKWICNKINHDTYERWHSIINTNMRLIRGVIANLTGDQEGVYKIAKKNLEKLSDLKYVFNVCNTNEKRELVKLGFDQKLYYQNGIYRTPFIIEPLSHNHLIMKNKGLLLYEKKRGAF